MKKIFISVTVIILIVVATYLKHISNELSDKGSGYVATFSPERSKKLGLFEYYINVEPKQFTTSNGEIKVTEAWVEKISTNRWVLIWFYKPKIEEGYQFILKTGSLETGVLTDIHFLKPRVINIEESNKLSTATWATHSLGLSNYWFKEFPEEGFLIEYSPDKFQTKTIHLTNPSK